VPAVSFTEQVEPWIRPPPTHSRTILAGPVAVFNTLLVRSPLAGLRKEEFVRRVMSKAFVPFEPLINTPTLSCVDPG